MVGPTNTAGMPAVNHPMRVHLSLRPDDCCLASSVFRSSRVRFRRRSLRCRCRPNLALSPFLSDTVVPLFLSPGKPEPLALTSQAIKEESPSRFAEFSICDLAEDRIGVVRAVRLPGLQFYRDSLPGVRSVIDGIASVGCLFNAAKEIRNAARQTQSSQRKIFLENATSTMGLKSTAIAKNPALQTYLCARHACRTTRRADTQTTSSTRAW